MKQRIAIALGVLGLYLVFVVALVPANVVLSMVNLPSSIKIAGVEGTVWDSKLKALQVNELRIDNIKSQVSPLSLLMFSPAVDVTFGDAISQGLDGYASVTGLMSSLHISNAQINVPANMAAQFAPLPIDLQAHRTLAVTIDEYTVGAPSCAKLVGRIKWKKAAVTVYGEKITLGDLQGDLSCQQGEVTLTINQPNELGLQLQVAIGQNGQPYGEGFIKPNPTTPQAILQVLPLFSKANAQGQYPLRF